MMLPLLYQGCLLGLDGTPTAWHHVYSYYARLYCMFLTKYANEKGLSSQIGGLFLYLEQQLKKKIDSQID